MFLVDFMGQRGYRSVRIKATVNAYDEVDAIRKAASAFAGGITLHETEWVIAKGVEIPTSFENMEEDFFLTINDKDAVLAKMVRPLRPDEEMAASGCPPLFPTLFEEA